MEPTTNNIDRERSVRAISTPDWRKHAIDPRWHLGGEAGGSFVTRCNGRWAIDETIATIERPPYLERCDACERSRIDVVRIEAGLAELERNAPANYDWASAHEFDLGGEG